MGHSLDVQRAARHAFRIGLLVMLLVGLIGAQGKPAVAGPLPPTGGPVVAARDDGLTVQWSIPEPQLTTNAEGRLEVRLAGTEASAAGGEPILPVVNLLVALPPSGAPSLVITQQASRMAPLKAPLALAPRDVQSAPEADFAPAKLALPAYFEEVGILRGVRLGRLVLRPVTVKEDGQLEIFSRLQVELNFNAALKPTPTGGDALLEQVKARVVNPEQVQSTLLDRSAPTTALPEPTTAVTPVMAMQISQAGLYQVSYAELAEAGFPVDAVDFTKLHITHAGADVAVEQIGDGDTKFEAGEALRFYASPRVQRWSTYDTYFLSVTTSAAPVMGLRSVAPGTETAGVIEAEKIFEQNLFYPFFEPIRGPIDAGRDGDRWMWERMIATSLSSDLKVMRFDLDNVDSTKTGTLTVYLNGAADYTHVVEIRVNGTLLGTATWSGRTAKAQLVSVPTGLLLDINNQLELKLSTPSSASEVWLDAFKVRYKEDITALSGENAFFGEANTNRKYTAYLSSAASAVLYDVTDPHAPLKLTGFTTPTTSSIQFTDALGGRAYLAATTIRAVTFPETLRVSPAVQPGGGDYLIIAHPNFLAGVAPLVAHRQSKELSVVVENVQAIYDAYGQGLPTPESIRAYISNAYYNWNTPPQYVLLVGDGTWDPKRYKIESAITYIPPYLNLSNQMGEYASDNRFVTVDETDLLPDVLIGRLPVNTPTELAVMVEKIINYENNPPTGDWRRRGTVVADYPLPGDYDFPLLSDRLLTQMHLTPLIREKIYYKENYLTGDATTAAILNAINQGTALISFAGHASWHVWGGRTYETTTNEPLFSYEPETPLNDDLHLLTNGYKLPVVMEFTCETSRFDVPDFDMIDEALVRKQGGGAIAVFGPTSPGYSGSHELLGKGFITGVQTGTATTGQAMLSAKLNLLTTYPEDFLADTYLILGDPAVKIQLEVVSTTSFYLPLISR